MTAAAWLPSGAAADMCSAGTAITATILAGGHTTTMAMNTTAIIAAMATAGLSERLRSGLLLWPRLLWMGIQSLGGADRLWLGMGRQSVVRLLWRLLCALSGLSLSAAFWLTDYIISQDLQAAYAAHQEAGEVDGAPAAAGGAAGADARVKQQIADEVKEPVGAGKRRGGADRAASGCGPRFQRDCAPVEPTAVRMCLWPEALWTWWTPTDRSARSATAMCCC